MTRQNASESDVNASEARSRDRRVLVLSVLGGLLFFLPWLTQQRVTPIQGNQYIHDGQYLYVQRLAVTPEVKPIHTQSLKRVAKYPIGLATATASQPVSPAVLSCFFNLEFPLNMATMKELELLPGIGPNLAREIYTHRMRFGYFTSVKQLQAIPGIGEKTLQRLQPLLNFAQ